MRSLLQSCNGNSVQRACQLHKRIRLTTNGVFNCLNEHRELLYNLLYSEEGKD